jgi:simple sugar transport system permease protein
METLAPAAERAEPAVVDAPKERWWTTLRTARPEVVFVLSLFSGLVVSAFVIVISLKPSRAAWGELFSHPGHTFSVTAHALRKAYGALLSGSLGSTGAFGHTLTAAVPLAIAGMGLVIAFRSGVFNIGAQAQMIGGAVLASWVGFSFGGWPTPVHVALGLVAAAAGGAAVGLIPAFLKTRTGASEVIVTIMANYVMAALLVYLISNTFFSQRQNSSPVGRLTAPSGTWPSLFGRSFGVNAGLIVAAVVLGGGWVLMSKSRLGFELELSGTSPGASANAGISPARVFIVAFVISGAVVGLAGGVQILGTTHQLQSGFGGDIGVLAITVAFVGRNRPIGVLLASLLYGILQTGSLQMQGSSGVSYQLSNVIVGIIVLFMTAPALVAEIYRLRPAAGANLRLAMSRGWGK